MHLDTCSALISVKKVELRGRSREVRVVDDTSRQTSSLTQPSYSFTTAFYDEVCAR